MTTLTMRLVKGDFIVTGPDIAPMKFKSRPEARDWCKTHHPGSPITEIGPGGKARRPRNRQSDRAGEGVKHSVTAYSKAPLRGYLGGPSI